MREDKVDFIFSAFFFFNEHKYARHYAEFLRNNGGQDRPSPALMPETQTYYKVITSGVSISKKCWLLRSHTTG